MANNTGATSDAEVLELLLTRPMALEELRERLQGQLPSGVQLLGAKEVPIFKADGSNYEKLGALLKEVEYQVLLTRAVQHQEDGSQGAGQKGNGERIPTLQAAVAAALENPVYSKQVETVPASAALLS